MNAYAHLGGWGRWVASLTLRYAMLQHSHLAEHLSTLAHADTSYVCGLKVHMLAAIGRLGAAG